MAKNLFTSKTFMALAIGVPLVAWVVGSFFWSTLTVSPQTTVVTSPLAADGLPDYEAYLLAQLSEGVTPENNAAVLLWQATWPEGLGPQDRGPLLAALGMPEEPDADAALRPFDRGETWAAVKDWFAQQLAPGVDDADAADGETLPRLQSSADEVTEQTHARPWTDQQVPPLAKWLRDGETLPQLQWSADEVTEQAYARPWTNQQVPPLATWLRDNAGAINLVAEATRRPRYFSPPPEYLNGTYNSLIAALLPMAQNSRLAARALGARAMNHAGHGRLDAAWSDVAATLRLARLVAQGGTLVEHMVALAHLNMAARQAVSILGHPDLSAANARRILGDLQSLPPLPPVADKIDQAERLVVLDVALGLIAGRGDPLDLGHFAGIVTGAVHGDHVLCEINGEFDKVFAIAQIEERSQRIDAYSDWTAEFSQRGQQLSGPGAALGALASKSKRSQAIADILLTLMMTATEAASDAEDRGRATGDLLVVAAALAMHRAEQGAYPATLEELVPRILPEIPADLYSGKPFVYRRIDDGFVLYSVFENGVDDGGDDWGEKSSTASGSTARRSTTEMTRRRWNARRPIW